MSGRGELLRQLVVEDGLELEGKGENRMARCPFHNDTGRKNLSVNVSKGVYYCFSCDAQGDVVDYLRDKRGLSTADALELVKGEDNAPPANAGKRRESKRTEKAKTAKSLPDWALSQHRYEDGDGTLSFIVCRLPPKKGDESQSKRYWQYVPIPKTDKGHEWQIGGLPSTNRPLYRLPEIIAADPDRQVMIVEGEKVADAVHSAFDGRALVATFAGGTKAVNRTDFRPLAKRKVVLVADEDNPGRECMTALALRLYRMGCVVRIALPEGDSGDDLADVIAKGGSKAAAAYLRTWVGDFTPPLGDAVDGDAPAKPHVLESNAFFEVLGNVGENVVIRLHTSVMLQISREGIQRPQRLGAIAADMNWWQATFGIEGLTASTAQRIGMQIIGIADRKGQIELQDVVSRGASITKDGHVIWNLGDRLLYKGQFFPLSAPPDGRIYTTGPAIEVGDLSKPLTSDEKFEIAEVMMRYRFKTMGDGQRMLGWIVSAIAGGAFAWRPHLWMLGKTSVGKSWWIKSVMLPIFDSLYVRLADWTGPSTARRMGSDSLPLIIDEAEPERREIREVVTLCRIAAGAEGERTRSEGSGQGVISQFPRFSAIMSSVKLPTLENADNNRFSLIQFSPTGVDDWPKLEGDLMRIFGPGSDIPLRLRTAIIADTAEIARRAEENTRGIIQMGESDARQAMIQGVLTAGWEWWTGGEELVPTQMPRQMSVDQRDILDEIFSIRIRLTPSLEVSILKMLVTNDNLDALFQYGIAKRRDGLLIAPTNPAIRRALRGTAFEAVDLASHLRQIDGAIWCDNPRSFGRMFRARAVMFPYDVLNGYGFNIQHHAQVIQGDDDDSHDVSDAL